MTKNLHYHLTFKRGSKMRMAFLGFFLLIASWPRVFIENFTRVEMGRRYFSFSLCVILIVLLTGIPFGLSRYDRNVLHVIGNNITLYAYLVAFAIASWRRHKETNYKSGEFDGTKFTLCTGLIRWQFFKYKIFGKEPSIRLVATVLEPGVFFIAGLVLALLSQKIGYLFIMSSVIYSLSWAAAFKQGDEFSMDIMDEIIANEEKAAVFMQDAPPQQTRGYEFFGRRPVNTEFKRKFADAISMDEPAAKVF